MRIIAFASQKGGVGKTTLAGHLAVEAERQGVGPVALLDTDPQGSLAAWWNVRAAEVPVFVQGDLAKLKSQPHPTKCRADQGATLYDWAVWMVANSGAAGRAKTLRTIKAAIS